MYLKNGLAKPGNLGGVFGVRLGAGRRGSFAMAKA